MASDISTLDNRATPCSEEAPTRRSRILDAAFTLFMAHGYAGTSTLAIASRARLSKRDLYAEFAGKREILAACIESRASQFRAPLALPPPRTAQELVAILIRFGSALRLGVTAPQVLATIRLAVQEAHIAPDLAAALNQGGRIASVAAATAFIADAQGRRLLGPGDPAQMAAEFLSLALGDHILQHLLGTAPPETPALAEHHARRAAEALLILHPPTRRR